MGARSGPLHFTVLDHRGLILRKLRARASVLMETDLERKSTSVKVFQFLFPWVLFALFLALTVGGTALSMGRDTASNLLNVWIFYSVPVMGKEILIPKTILSDNAPPAYLVGGVTSLVDICTSLFLIWNYDWVKKVRYLGPKLKAAEEKGRDRVQRSKWFSKAAFLATTFFVFVPFKGAGGVGGTILGRMMGLRPYRVLLAVLIGSMIESLGYAYLSETISPLLNDSPVFSWLRNVNMLQMFIVIVMFILLLYVVRNPKKAALGTTKVLYRTLDLAEEGVVQAEGLARGAQRFRVMHTAEVLDRLDLMGDKLVDIPLDLAAAPVKVMGRYGETLGITIKEEGRGRIKTLRRRTKGILSEGMGHVKEGAERTLERAADMTIVGLRTMKGGVRKGEYIVIMAGGHVERVIKAPRRLMAEGKRKLLKEE